MSINPVLLSNKYAAYESFGRDLVPVKRILKVPNRELYTFQEVMLEKKGLILFENFKGSCVVVSFLFTR